MYIPDSLIEHWSDLGNQARSAPPTLAPFTLHSGQSLSDAVAVPSGMRAVGLLVPSTWTASNISFQISFDGSTFYEMSDATIGDATYEIVTGVVGGISLYLPVWNAFRAPSLKIRSGTLASPQVQGGDRAMNIICVNCNAADH